MAMAPRSGPIGPKKTMKLQDRPWKFVLSIYLLAFIVSWVVGYLTGSFISTSFDIEQWSFGARLFVAICSTISSIILGSVWLGEPVYVEVEDKNRI
jgi:hypothetical protein